MKRPVMFAFLKKLTSINLTAFCDQCQMNRHGVVTVDNMLFEK